MKSTSTTIWSLAQVFSLAPVGSLGVTHRPIDPAFSSLSSMLSGDADIYLPGSEGFVNGTASLAAKKPKLDALVRVVTEEDVQNTVCVDALCDSVMASVKTTDWNMRDK